MNATLMLYNDSTTAQHTQYTKKLTKFPYHTFTNAFGTTSYQGDLILKPEHDFWILEYKISGHPCSVLHKNVVSP